MAIRYEKKFYELRSEYKGKALYMKVDGKAAQCKFNGYYTGSLYSNEILPEFRCADGKTYYGPTIYMSVEDLVNANGIGWSKYCDDWSPYDIRRVLNAIDIAFNQDSVCCNSEIRIGRWKINEYNNINWCTHDKEYAVCKCTFLVYDEDRNFTRVVHNDVNNNDYSTDCRRVTYKDVSRYFTYKLDDKSFLTEEDAQSYLLSTIEVVRFDDDEESVKAEDKNRLKDDIKELTRELNEKINELYNK